MAHSLDGKPRRATSAASLGNAPDFDRPDVHDARVDLAACFRMAAVSGDADILFMKHHGVMVLGQTIAEAWDDLYYQERACEVQLLALSTGRAIVPVQTEVAEAAYRQKRQGDAESAALHLTFVKRQLDRTEPDYRN